MTERKQRRQNAFARTGAATTVCLWITVGCNPEHSDAKRALHEMVQPASAGVEHSRTPPAKARRQPVRSLLQLIARPEEHDGAPVLVSGYFVVEGDWGVNGLLYLTENDATWGLDSRVGIGLGPCKKRHRSVSQLEPSDVDEYEKTYVLVEGTFAATPGSVHLGVICGVTRMEQKWRSTHFAPSENPTSVQ